MRANELYIERCKQIIEKKLEWGDSGLWRSKDFENLSSIIFDQTGISLSTSTLRRIWGHNSYAGHPNLTTLDTLAMFAGFNDWRSFQKSFSDEKGISTLSVPTRRPVFLESRKKGKVIAISSGILLVILLISIAVSLKPTKDVFLDDARFVFKTKHMAGGIPNSVVFTYHIPQSVEDSVYIQQSWDSTRRVNVALFDSIHTSMYYEPGIHHAKLLVGDSVVKEETVMIRTDGWAGLIENRPIPIYLDSLAYMKGRYIDLDPIIVKDHGIDMRLSPKSVQFFNIGNFEPVQITDLYFSTDLKHGYDEGASACQFSTVVLYTDQQNPIFIPVSQKGCISDLNLLMPDRLISGKKHNLSGFGTDISQWTNLSCEAKNGVFTFNINGETVYQVAITNERIKVVGIAYFFYGTGGFRNILLRNGRNGKDIFRVC